jgi:transcriptional regulator with XRE-family HTH domain
VNKRKRELSVRLLALRLENHLQQGEMALALGLPLPTYRSYEYGKKFPSSPVAMDGLNQRIKSAVFQSRRFKLNDAQIAEIQSKRAKGYTVAKLEKEYAASAHYIKLAVLGRSSGILPQ